GCLHAGSVTYSKGVYSIGYRFRKVGGSWSINEEDRIVFSDFLPSDENIIYALGSDLYNYYYIATNEINDNKGSIPLMNFSNGDYELEVIVKDIDGKEDRESVFFTIVESKTDADDEIQSYPLELISNYPNPFNPTTTISYSLAENIQNPKIEIYNMKGQKVKSYQLEETSGESSVTWNGKDGNDKSVSSGVYFYRLVNEGKTVQSRKMILLK
ncbi:MAG: T9SS type A sorting domain-containing protein, partial [Candidatus Cloacimonetes bacterium]|nr:T9SS type A sorting domain-containing protein [Candidatus Cloacimonadota bacterium]